MNDPVALICPLRACPLLSGYHPPAKVARDGLCSPDCSLCNHGECVAAEAAQGQLEIARHTRLLPYQIAPLVGLRPEPLQTTRQPAPPCGKAERCRWQRTESLCPPRQAVREGLDPRRCL